MFNSELQSVKPNSILPFILNVNKSKTVLLFVSCRVMSIISDVDSNVMDFVFTSFVHRFHRKQDENNRSTLCRYNWISGRSCQRPLWLSTVVLLNSISFILFFLFFAPISIRRLTSTTLDKVVELRNEVQFYLICRIHLYVRILFLALPLYMASLRFTNPGKPISFVIQWWNSDS